MTGHEEEEESEEVDQIEQRAQLDPAMASCGREYYYSLTQCPWLGELYSPHPVHFGSHVTCFWPRKHEQKWHLSLLGRSLSKPMHGC